jgi:threonine aldolase
MGRDTSIDLRSDTVTLPTSRMRRAMAAAEVGDDVLQEDPTINALERLAAQLVGKEAALFVPSGTFGNQLALFTHCVRGNEVVLSEHCHIVQHEAGAASIIAGVQLRTFVPAGSWPTWEDIAPRLRHGGDIHYPDTGLIALENALSNGEVIPLADMRRIAAEASRLGIPLHLDGARIFNAACYLGVEAAEIAASVDSVMFCLSKGLCAPVGSMLAGREEFIEKARRKRKIMGGGMRQAGVLAAAGLIALQEMRERLPEDRRKAEMLAEAFRRTGLFDVLPEPVKINMLFVRFRSPGVAGQEELLVEELAKAGVKTYPPEAGWVRFVTHHDVSSAEVQQACRIVAEAAVRAAGQASLARGGGSC